MGIMDAITLRREVHSVPQSGVKWIQWPPRELGSGRPQGAEILHKLRASCEISQYVLAATPIFYLQAIVPEHLIGEIHPIIAVTLAITLVVSGLRV
jgi:hypothetical protein